MYSPELSAPALHAVRVRSGNEQGVQALLL